MLSKNSTENSGSIERFKILRRCDQNLRGAERLSTGTIINTSTVAVLLEVSNKEKTGALDRNNYMKVVHIDLCDQKKSKLFLCRN